MQNTLPSAPDAAGLEAPEDGRGWMLRGAQLHAAGQLEQALIAFEKALALQPDDVNAASACATLLSALSRPVASYKALLSVEALLLETADGAANLAIAAESCGDLARARVAYQRALALDPNHARSLNNVGLMAAAQAQWEAALECAHKCLAQDPAHAPYHVNLSDYLCGARRYADALAVLETAAARFPDNLDIRIRSAAVLAFNGDFEKSLEASRRFDAATLAYFQEFLGRAIAPAYLDHKLRLLQGELPDARQLYTGQAFEAMTVCDWRDNDQVTATLRQMLDECLRTGQRRDWRDAQFYGLMLGMDENELAQVRKISIAKIGEGLKASLPPFVQRPKTAVRRDDRIHIGITVQSLRDERHAHALKRQLALHDSSRFAIHIYSPTRHPELEHSEMLKPHAASVTEIAHMSDIEAAGRMRLDPLDVFVDMTFDTAWCRPEIPELRVAPVQVRQLTWHRHNPPRPCDYNMSDTFVHPDGLDLAPYGAIVRLPHTCWLATHDEEPESGWDSREQAGLPTDALVLSAVVPSVMLDPQSFGAWMKILRSLPDAVLWLPAYSLPIAANLVREANAAGVNENRLLFAARLPRAQSLACLKHADLFLDTLRFNANQGLEDALRVGVPALSCAGDSMASRLGGSIIRAAGLPQCVMQSEAAYVVEAVRLGRNPQALQQLRQQLLAEKAKAPLLDLAARVREWEAAWATMAERTRAGLAPAAFDVPSSGKQPAG
ncbi:Predicted O-linked N-acetylglucosamine transferase, SPINDLY family [Polaromonas sp. YR568]|uniref:O-linked N-acetylglucosamine transferase family protein n=1 Tax=Polaromonas sp. YR568 TaxID=1855301 RepID=UPI0008F01A9A|nr:tetratricopeptide repeat protein [Polaromonas sp. YR568]SFU29009.1 Predicted O-linked N-acetylglucosamine transferase, SPINDLY family [Polaromonas sp. YR568]